MIRLKGVLCMRRTARCNRRCLYFFRHIRPKILQRTYGGLSVHITLVIYIVKGSTIHTCSQRLYILVICYMSVSTLIITGLLPTTEKHSWCCHLFKALSIKSFQKNLDTSEKENWIKSWDLSPNQRTDFVEWDKRSG